MKLYFLCLSALTVGALCKINDVCIVQSVKTSFFFDPVFRWVKFWQRSTDTKYDIDVCRAKRGLKENAKKRANV